MRNYDNYRLSLTRKENEILDSINQNKKPNRTMDEVFNDENIEFASISIGKGRDDNDIKNSIIKVKGINKLLVDERTVIGNITENLDDRKYIAVDDRDLFNVQVVLNGQNIAFDGPYESAEDAFVLDMTVDAVNKSASKNNIELGWVNKAYLINSQRCDSIEYEDKYINKTDFYNDAETAVIETNNEGINLSSRGYQKVITDDNLLIEDF